MERMTIGKVKRLCQQYKYVLLRDYRGVIYGCNTKILSIGNNNDRHGNKKSIYISFKPCDLQEYITNKIPFI